MADKKDLRQELQTGIGVIVEDDGVLDYGICINNERIMWKSGGFDRIWEDFDEELYSCGSIDYRINTLVRDINSFTDIETGKGVVIWSRDSEDDYTIPVKGKTLESISKKLSDLTSEIINLQNKILEISNGQES